MYRRGFEDHPHGKEMQKGKMVIWEGLTNSCEKKRSEKQRRKGKICHFNAEFQRIARRDKKLLLASERFVEIKLIFQGSDYFFVNHCNFWQTQTLETPNGFLLLISVWLILACLKARETGSTLFSEWREEKSLFAILLIVEEVTNT